MEFERRCHRLRAGLERRHLAQAVAGAGIQARILQRCRDVVRQRLECSHVICVKGVPGIQVLERVAPAQRMQPEQIERQEFEYCRHGTINLLAGLNVYTGHMWTECLDRNDSAHFQPALRRFLHPYGWAKRIHLILDEGPSHVSASTRAVLDELAPRLRVLLTPVAASWLNQAELLLEAFGVRYLTRGDWATRTALVSHIVRSRVEYNDCFAHPFDWHWTRRDFRLWLYNTPDLISCKT